jgi:type IV pilus assembly protein PilB
MSYAIQPTCLSLLSAAQARRFRALPFAQGEQGLRLLGDARTSDFLPQLRLLLERPFEVEQITPSELDRLLLQHYPEREDRTKRNRLQGDAEVIGFIDEVIERAVAMGASDIHLECYEKRARIRFRWEGQLVEKYEVPLEKYRALISRLKIMAELDIAEKRLPQDGRISYELGERSLDLRLSTLAGKHGEKAVLRLLMRSDAQLSLDRLGFDPALRTAFEKAIQSPNGLILITGPTGSGKTTTLYASLHFLNRPEKNLLTVEDPVEYQLEGVNQVQVKPAIGLSFERVLRAFLRQDPDIIMVGEIRDLPTARIALRAALTGHLVFSTLHTNSAWDALARLCDMGLEPYLLASALRMVVAQRLVRSLCEHCRQAVETDASTHWLQRQGISRHWEARGCPQCYYTGYQGRQAVFELLPVQAELAEMIRAGASPTSEWLQQQGILNLEQQFVELVKAGRTSLEEVLTHLQTFAS